MMASTYLDSLPRYRDVIAEKWWKFRDVGNGLWVARRLDDEGELEVHTVGAHCLQCAKALTLAKYGGETDLRGSIREHGADLREVISRAKFPVKEIDISHMTTAKELIAELD